MVFAAISAICGLPKVVITLPMSAEVAIASKTISNSTHALFCFFPNLKYHGRYDDTSDVIGEQRRQQESHEANPQYVFLERCILPEHLAEEFTYD